MKQTAASIPGRSAVSRQGVEVQQEPGARLTWLVVPMHIGIERSLME